MISQVINDSYITEQEPLQRSCKITPTITLM